MVFIVFIIITNSGYMELAIILITLEPSSDNAVLQRLKKIDGVKEAHFVYGPYDAYAKIEATTHDQIQSIVFDKIRMLNGIRSTMTCFIAD